MDDIVKDGRKATGKDVAELFNCSIRTAARRIAQYKKAFNIKRFEFISIDEIKRYYHID